MTARAVAGLNLLIVLDALLDERSVTRAAARLGYTQPSDQRDRQGGTLGVDREAPVGLTDIALTFELDTDTDAATVQRLVEMSESFCVIYQTLRAPPRLTVTHRTAAAA